jgi:glycine/D-amino acid oxidase-like deaminating enzyme
MLRHKISKDLGFTLEEFDSKVKRFRMGCRPFSPDNIEILGPMKHFPNVVLNVGYGSQGY